MTLEAKVAERTTELSRTVEVLQQTRAELLHSEKLAALGSMVAGISHELNTPIGNTLMVATTLQAQVRELNDVVSSGNVKKSTFEGFLRSIDEMSELLVRSCGRASDLIASFKQVAVDQTSERRRSFDLKEVVADVLTLARTTFKHEPWVLEDDVPTGIICDSFPGPLGQVVTNLVQNACVHGFAGRQHGRVKVSARLMAEGTVQLTVTDDGVGMDAATLSRVFDPFFTTRLGKGGSGLGMSVSHRIVGSMLGGSMRADSRPGEGTRFTVIFPAAAPARM
jgi:signal transduction histidine kinase